MDLKVFRLNESKYLEMSSVEVFSASREEGKSLFWVDIVEPDPDSMAEFLAPLQLHPIVLAGCLDPNADEKGDA